VARTRPASASNQPLARRTLALEQACPPIAPETSAPIAEMNAVDPVAARADDPSERERAAVAVLHPRGTTAIAAKAGGPGGPSSGGYSRASPSGSSMNTDRLAASRPTPGARRRAAGDVRADSPRAPRHETTTSDDVDGSSRYMTAPSARSASMPRSSPTSTICGSSRTETRPPSPRAPTRRVQVGPSRAAVTSAVDARAWLLGLRAELGEPACEQPDQPEQREADAVALEPRRPWPPRLHEHEGLDEHQRHRRHDPGQEPAQPAAMTTTATDGQNLTVAPWPLIASFTGTTARIATTMIANGSRRWSAAAEAHEAAPPRAAGGDMRPQPGSPLC
jgi:hypothetical protein